MYFIVLLFLFELSGGIQVTPQPVGSEFPTVYHDYDQMTQLMGNLVKNYSDIASLYSIGRSVEQKELWVLKIKGLGSSIIGTPHVKFIGNIHGNEPVGRELILQFAQYLLKNYNGDNEVKWILDRTTIHLLPSLNPDGFEKSVEGQCYTGPGRQNSNDVDLNRSFPDHFTENKIPIQPETLAVAQWMSKVPFLLSASFHGGALVANYPFDSNPLNERESLAPRYSSTPDDDVFKHLAQTYSSNHLTMHKGRTCDENQPLFPGGITNGAAWYSFSGGMQDYNYLSQGCMELTLEISCCKYPSSGHLPRLWVENKRAMMELLKQSQIGVRGTIMDKITSNYIPDAVLLISGRNVPFRSSKNGEFWRILLPGNYLLIVQAKGYESQSFPFTVEQGSGSRPNATWLNIYLRPLDDLIAESSQIVQQVENTASLHSNPVVLFVYLLIAYFVTSNHIS